MSESLLPRSINVPPTAEAAAPVRRFVTDRCAEWSAGDVAGTAALLADELVVNAVRHARTPVTVSVARRPDAVIVHVSDESQVAPRVREPEELDESGRGLMLVEALARRWGTATADGGKRVWAEVDAPPLPLLADPATTEVRARLAANRPAPPARRSRKRVARTASPRRAARPAR